jgi:autotransporter-associated beta strand protein
VDNNWDTSSGNWSGAGSTWIDGNDAIFSNTAVNTSIAVVGTRTAGMVRIGNGVNNAYYTFTNGMNGMISSDSFIVQGNGSNGAGAGNATPARLYNQTINISSNLGVGRWALIISGTSTVNVGNLIGGNIAGVSSADWGTLTIQDSAVVTASNGVNGNTEAWQLQLYGGTLFAPSIQASDREAAGTANLIFRGTRVVAMQDNASFVTVGNNYNGTQSAYIGTGGAVLDSNGHDIGIGINLKPYGTENGGLTKLGTGMLSLRGTNTYTGVTTISSGVLCLEKMVIGAIVDDAMLIISNTLDDAYGNVITGTGNVHKAGTGKLSLFSSCTHSGATVISSGTLELAAKPVTGVAVSNASFETHDALANVTWGYSPSGATWAFGGTAGISAPNDVWVAAGATIDGSYAGFVQNSGSFSQSIVVTNPGSYMLTFIAANRPGYNASGVEIKIDGLTLATFAAGVFQSGAVFQSFSNSIILTAGTHTLAFAGVQNGADSATAIDQIIITPVSGGSLSTNTSVYLTDGAWLSLSNPAQTVSRLYLDGKEKAPGTYGAVGSGASNVSTNFFTGTGVLKVVNGKFPPGTLMFVR